MSEMQDPRNRIEIEWNDNTKKFTGYGPLGIAATVLIVVLLLATAVFVGGGFHF